MANGTEHEIERMVVRIVGDNKDYVKSLEESAAKTTQTTDKIVGDLHKVEQAQKDAARKKELLAQMDADMFSSPSWHKPPPIPPIDPVVNAKKQTEAYYQAVKDLQYRQAQTTNFLSAVEEKAAKEKIDLENRMLEAARLHEAEERRFAAEAIRRDKERIQVERQLANERKQIAREQQRVLREEERDRKKSVGALMGMRGGAPGKMDITGSTGFTPPPTGPFGGSIAGLTKMLGPFTAALAGLAAVNEAVHQSQAILNNEMEKFNFEISRGADLIPRLNEQMAYRRQQADETNATLNPKDRIENQQKELEMLQKEIDGQKQVKEAAEAAARAKQAGLAETMLKGTTLPFVKDFAAVGYGGREAQRKELEKNLQDAESVLKSSIDRRNKLQRELSNSTEGGDDAQNALNRFRTRMQEQIDIVGKSHKAIMLARLTHEQNLSESQKREAEALYDALEKKKEAYARAQQVTDDYFDAEIKMIDAAAAMEKKIFSADPVRKYREEIDELVGMFEDGYLSAEAFGMGLDQIGKRLDGEGGGKTNALHKFASSLAGSAEAMSKSQDYSFALRGAPGQTGTPELKALQDIRNELRTLNKKPTVAAKPVNS